MEEKIKAVVESEGFVEKMLACEEPEQVQALFAENGIELSLDEVMQIGKSLDLALNHDSEELDEDDLDAVAGGSAAVIVGAIIAVVNVVAKNWRSIKKFFRRW